MRIAVNNWRKVGEEWKNDPAYVNVVHFKNVGPELVKGVQIVAQGKLSQNNWTSKSGEKRSEIEVIAFNITIADTPAGAAAPAEEYEDDIPF